MFKEFLLIPQNIDFSISNYFLIIFSILLIFISIKLIFAKSLIESLIIMSIFSLLISVCYLMMDAPDVAMTEVALGACLSTCVLLNFLKFIGNSGNLIKHTRRVVSAILCSCFVVILSIVSFELPEYGLGDSPLQNHLTKYYVANTQREIGTPSIVSAILASYRGYDTLGETAVILIAGLAVLLILSVREEDA